MTTDQDIRDALQLLADRAPATCPVPGDGSIGTAGRRYTGPKRRPWGLLATAAALAVLVAGIIAYTVTGLSGSSGDNGAPAATNPGPTTVVSCSSPSGHDASADRPAIQRRLAALGGKDITVTASGAALQASADGVQTADVQNLCATGALDLRGVVAPPVPVTCNASTTPCSPQAISDAATAGHFTVPTDDTAYGRLSSHQQDLLTTALGGFDCASATTEPSAADGYFVACADGGNYGITAAKIAFLLGPAFVSNPQVESAAAVAPNAQAGQVEWTVNVSATTAGQAAIAGYTGAHNTGGTQLTGTAMQCSAATIPCADYVGYTIDGSVVSAPVTVTAITGGQTQIAGEFTSSAARGLAGALTGGPLPVPLQLGSVDTVK